MASQATLLMEKYKDLYSQMIGLYATYHNIHLRFLKTGSEVQARRLNKTLRSMALISKRITKITLAIKNANIEENKDFYLNRRQIRDQLDQFRRAYYERYGKSD
jgi:hypothetical protein